MISVFGMFTRGRKGTSRLLIITLFFTRAKALLPMLRATCARSIYFKKCVKIPVQNNFQGEYMSDRQRKIQEVITRIWKEPEFKKNLISDPKGTLAKAG